MRLVERQVHHGLVGIGLALAMEAEHHDGAAFPSQVLGRVDPVRAHPLDPVRQPQGGPPVSPVLREGRPLADGHEPRRERERLEPDGVSRPLVVEGEAARVVADAVRAPRVLGPPPFATDGRFRFGSGDDRIEPIVAVANALAVSVVVWR